MIYTVLVFHTVHLFLLLYTKPCICIIELIADDDDKQQLLNYMIQVCRPKDWQISLLEDRLAKGQLASSRYHRLDNVLEGQLNV